MRIRRWALLGGSLLFLFPAAIARADSETGEDPVREMLLARYQSEEAHDAQWIKGLALPSNLGLTREELLNALDSLKEALSTWKIEFHPGYAAFAVQSATHLLSVNPQSMESILQEDNDVLLHESVHLSDSQVQRQLYGLYSELIFLEWMQDHLDEDKASAEETQLNRTLNPDDILRLKLWTPTLKTDAPALEAAENAFRASWICEIQAYDIQLMAFEQELKQGGASSLKQAAAMLRQTLLSETGSASAKDQEDLGAEIFESFSAGKVTEGFQESVLPCVLMNTHDALLFQTLAEAHGWNIKKSKKNSAYRHELYAWARRNILRWNALKTESYALSDVQMNELRQNGLLAPAK